MISAEQISALMGLRHMDLAYRPRLLASTVAVAMLAAACSASSSDGSVVRTASSEGAASSDGSGSEAIVDADAIAEPVEAESVDESQRSQATLADYNADPAGSALRGDRSNASFPSSLIDIDDIQRGGPPPDGIPPIDDPVFAPVAEIDFLTDDEGIVVVEVDGDVRGYPIQILIWHEIVNDSIAGEPVTVTFCPLCNSALVFHRQFGDRVLDFGTSGELYQSALVMYDRQTESLWAHFTGQGIVGHYAGAQLDLIPAQTLGFGDFADRYPDALVLTLDTGFDRSYGLNPYVGYDDAATDPIGAFISQDIDDRLAPKTRIVGVLAPDGPVATTLEALAVVGVLSIGQQGSVDVVLFHRQGLKSALEAQEVDGGRDVGQTGAFLAKAEDGTTLTFTASSDGFVDQETGSLWTVTGDAIEGTLEGQTLVAVPHLDTFWFAWSTYRPNAVLLPS